LRDWRSGRPDLGSQLADALRGLEAGRVRGVLLAGARGSGRSALAAEALRGNAAPVLRDADLSAEELADAVQDALGANRPFVACVSASFARRLLGRAEARRGVIVIPVPPMHREEVADALADRLGLAASARLVSEAWRASGGNAALLQAVVEDGIAGGAIQGEGHAAQLIAPLALDWHRIRALPIVAALGPAARGALERLALVEPAPRALATELVGAAALAGLIDEGLVQRTSRKGTRPETVWILPQAIADRLRAEAAPELAAEVHGRVLASPMPRIAEEWRALGRARSLLWWYEQGADGEPPLSPVAAVRAANRVHLGEVAADLASYALERGPDLELRRERAFARRFLGDPGGALDDLREIRPGGDDARTTIGIADLEHYEHGEADAAIALLRSSAAASGEGPARRELLGALVSHLAYAGRFAECEAEHRALPAGSLHERGRADVAHAMTWSHRGGTVQALRRLYRYQLLPTADTPSWFSEELQGALFVCLLQAHGPGRALAATGILGDAEASPFVRFDDVSALTGRVSVLLAQGHAAQALRLALSVEASDEQDRSGFGAHALALGAEAAAYLGEDARSRALEARFRRTPDRAAGVLRPNSEAALCAAALIRGEPGAPERARDLAAELAGAGLMASALRVAQAGLRLGDPGCARLAADWGRETSGEVCAVFAGHAAALLAADPHALGSIAERYLRLGFTLHAAEACCQAAALAQSSGVTDLAAEASSRARLILGLTDGIRAAHLAAAGGAPAELSRREREIALLVSQGASNRSIAQSLVISVRTVEGHLGRMYAKLGLADRRALAGYVRRGD